MRGKPAGLSRTNWTEHTVRSTTFVRKSSASWTAEDLLKDRVSDIAVLADGLNRIGEGECVIDPTIISRLVQRAREHGPLDELTEREVLGLMAEGRSNGGSARRCS